MSSGDNKDTTSTLQSVVDSVTGAAQSAYGSLTGSTTDKAAGENKKDLAAAEHDASHTAAKAGPFTLSSSGAIAQDNTDRTQGSWNQTIGSGKEMLGNVIGSEPLRQEGIRQNQEGKGQQAAGQLSDYGQGITDRVKGALGGAAAGLTGDASEQERRRLQHDEGKTRQRGVEAELQKQAEAEASQKEAQK